MNIRLIIFSVKKHMLGFRIPNSEVSTTYFPLENEYTDEMYINGRESGETRGSKRTRRSEQAAAPQVQLQGHSVTFQ
jgi:hypothetical protein